MTTWSIRWRWNGGPFDCSEDDDEVAASCCWAMATEELRGSILPLVWRNADADKVEWDEMPNVKKTALMNIGHAVGVTICSCEEVIRTWSWCVASYALCCFWGQNSLGLTPHLLNTPMNTYVVWYFTWYDDIHIMVSYHNKRAVIAIYNIIYRVWWCPRYLFS